MSNIFAGLESMGLKVDKIDIFEEEKKKKQEAEERKNNPPVIMEADFLFDKKMQCPVCDAEFRVKTVKSGKPRLLGADTDFRPKYAGIDSVKYDAIVCPKCGFAALSRFFNYMTAAQAKLIKENISTQFKGLEESGDTYTYDEAIQRHKLALLNSVIKRARVSERAYTCLKLAWLFRGKRENLPPETTHADNVKVECLKSESEMLNSAFEGFLESREKEDFPICGMDTSTFDYLLADLAFRIGKYEYASKFASEVIVSKASTSKLKERARDLRDEIKKKKA